MIKKIPLSSILEMTILLKVTPDPSLRLASVELDEIICWVSTSVWLSPHYLYEVWLAMVVWCLWTVGTQWTLRVQSSLLGFCDMEREVWVPARFTAGSVVFLGCCREVFPSCVFLRHVNELWIILQTEGKHWTPTYLNLFWYSCFLMQIAPAHFHS